MKTTLFLFGFVFLPSFATAQLEIKPITGNVKVEKRLEAMRSASSARSAKVAEFPTFEQFKEAVSKAKSKSGVSQNQVMLESLSRTMVEKLKCTLEIQTPSGVERKDGGLNGVMSVYLCPAGYLVTYETNYQAPLTQRVIVFDDDYAKKQTSSEPLIKETVATRGNIRFTSIRWLNADNEIRYEVFTNLKSSKDSGLEKFLKEGLKELAIKLSPAE